MVCVMGIEKGSFDTKPDDEESLPAGTGFETRISTGQSSEAFYEWVEQYEIATAKDAADEYQKVSGLRRTI